MLGEWRRRRALDRVQSGDGRPLKRFRWWQQLSRSLLYLPLNFDDGRRTVYAVDVRIWGDKETGEVMADLYRDGQHHARSKVPAVFPVEGGEIEVRASEFGLKRCHYVTPDGAEHQLVPDPHSAEGRRARLEQRHPALSRSIAGSSVVLLAIGVVLLVIQIVEPISEVPPIAENFGTFVSPVQLPVWLNVALGVGAAVAAVERALRLRYHWLLDAGAN